MKRSEINALIRDARECFAAHGWTLPPAPRWDVTDFGLGEPRRFGLVLVNLAEEPEYCEKLMFARENMATPAHCHRRKKEDIIARWGHLSVRVWAGLPAESGGVRFAVNVCGRPVGVDSGGVVELAAGERVTLAPGVYHHFWASGGDCIIGEVSTANDDRNDNFFVDPAIGRYPGIEEDEAPLVRLISEG